MPAPLLLLEPADDFAEWIAPDVAPDSRTPILQTARLVLRAPHLDDAPAVARLINDRRIAENLSRVPHPYSRQDAETFIAGANRADDEVAFLVTLRDGTLIGGCGVGTLARRVSGDRLLVRRRLLGPRLRDRGGARGDRLWVR